MAPNPPWSDLPRELLSTIANFLSSNPLDILSFRSVCKSWHSSSRNIPHCLFSRFLPLVTPSPPISFFDCPDLPGTERYVLSRTVVYALLTPENPLVEVQPNTWICFLDQWNNDKVSVRKPLSKRSPHGCYPSPLDFPKLLNMLDFHASEISRFYNLVYVDNSNNKGYMWHEEVLKVTILSNMSAVVVLSEDGVLNKMQLREGELECNKQWQTIHDGKDFCFDDIIEFKNMVLAVDRRGRFYEIGLDNYPVTFDLIVRTSTGGGGRRKRLVESSGDLYLVAHQKGGIAFKVYQLLFIERKAIRWGPVTNIGDRVFFFDLQFSFSASTQQLGCVYRNNCIIYTKQSFPKHGYDGEFSDNCSKFGLCHLEDPSYISHDSSNFKVFGDPPSWIFQK